MENSSNLMGDTYLYDVDYHRTAKFLGIDRNDREDFEVAKKVSRLRELAIEQGKGKKLEDTLGFLYDMKRKIGTQSLGKTLVDELYQYSVLSRSKPKVEKSQKFTPQGPIEKAIQHVVQKSIKQAMKG